MSLQTSTFIKTILQYLEKRLDYYSLTTQKAVIIALSNYLYICILCFCGGVCLIFFSAGLGLALGKLLGEWFYGLLIISLIYAGLGYWLFSKRKKLALYFYHLLEKELGSLTDNESKTIVNETAANESKTASLIQAPETEEAIL